MNQQTLLGEYREFLLFPELTKTKVGCCSAVAALIHACSPHVQGSFQHSFDELFDRKGYLDKAPRSNKASNLHMHCSVAKSVMSRLFSSRLCRRKHSRALLKRR